MRFGSVCSGIEAASVAWEPLGWKAAWFSEIEPFPGAVLAHHYPDTPNHGDMTTLPSRILRGEVEAPDLFCGGTPCQAFSVAGLRKSLDDARGNLSLTFCEIANAIDHVRHARGEQPCIVFWENVPGVLSTSDNAFGCFLGEIAGTDTAIVPHGGRWTNSGVVAGPKRSVAWRTLDAQYFGVAQRRRRVFVVASARDGFDPAAVLLEWEGLRRDSAPSREAWKGASVGVKDGPGDRRWPALIAPTLNAAFGDKQGLEDQHALSGAGMFVPDYVNSITAHNGARNEVSDIANGCVVQIAPTIPARSTGGGGLGTDFDCDGGVICAYPIWRGGDQANSEVLIDQAGTLNCNKGQQGGILIDVAHSLRGEGFDASEEGTGRGAPIVPVHAFDARQSGVVQYGDMTGPLDTDGHSVAVAFKHSMGSKAHGIGYAEEQAPTLGTDAANNAVMQAMQVRRLTPRECERLQGFPEARFTLRIQVCEDESNETASSAALSSAVPSREQSGPVAAHVLIDCERLEVLQLKAERFNSTAPSAASPNWSPQHTLTADIVRLAALTVQCAERAMLDGRVASLLSISDSSRPLNGSALARLSGRVIEELACDAERLTSDASLCMKSITSQHGQDSQSFALTLEISLCCVVAAIVSSIPRPTRQASSFVVIVETTTPYTLIPWRNKPASECPDGPRYKALGNSWAVPCVRWIGNRIKEAL